MLRCYNLPTLNLHASRIPWLIIPFEGREVELEVIAPTDRERITTSTPGPFNIGRGGVGDNTLQLADGRISRNCATITPEGAGFRLQDRGNRYGVFVNGARVDRHLLRDGDTNHLRH